MKIKCEIILDLDGKEYEIVFRNLKDDTEPLDYDTVEKALNFVFADWKSRVDDLGINSDDQILKHIN